MATEPTCRLSGARRLLLGSNTLGTIVTLVTDSLALCSASIQLTTDLLLTLSLSLGLEDVLLQVALVLEHVTLDTKVELVVAGNRVGWRESAINKKEIETRQNRCESIFLASRYFFNKRRSTRIRRIHCTLDGIRASLVPRRLPRPV